MDGFIMDHVADVNLTTLHKINQQFQIPDFVKRATIDRAAIESLPSSAFADPLHRRFPCHTREDTFLSYAYFLKNSNQLDNITRQTTWNNLRKRASDWAIHLACEDLLREHEKQAREDLTSLPDEQFAIVEEWNGEKYRALPLLNADCIKSAAAHLIEYRERYPLTWRQNAAVRIIKSANEFEINIQKMDYLEKAAKLNTPSRHEIATGMLQRALFINREHHGSPEQVAMLKAAKSVMQVKCNSLAQKAAEIIDCFDQLHNLKRFYSRGLPCPEEICFSSATAKEAHELRDQLVRLATGNTYTKLALEQAGLEPYRVLGNEFINAVRKGFDEVDIAKVAKIVPTLPLNAAKLLDRALKASSIKSASQVQRTLGIPTDINDWTSADWDKIIKSFKGM